ncbi:MAG: AAA family ATPase [Candidatus Dormibacteraceae bacterium]
MISPAEKPSDIFDRDFEWQALSRFIADEQAGATLGVVSGRRRQGKTYLLDAACRQAGGFYFGATEATEAESLHRMGEALTAWLESPAPLRFVNWHEVVDALLALGREHPIPAVIDELPYLVKASPSLPSIIQQAFGPRREQRINSRTRLLLCGSAMSFMGKLLSGSAPLRGRAGLELVVPTLDYRDAAQFWNISDWRLAVQVNAIVGGTPAYRREFARNDTPNGAEDFDSWVVRTVLNPESPLFREARYLLAEELEVRDPALYHSVLAAVAAGNRTRGGIAGYLDRRASDISHPLTVLEDAGLLARDADMFRENRATYRIAEPLVTFYHAVMRPVWDQLERPGSAARIWKLSRARFQAAVLGPHFEQLCRSWALHHADPNLLGGLAARVGSGTINDPTRQMSHQIDVAVLGVTDRGLPPLLSIGEAKWNQTMDRGHLERLHYIKALLKAGGRLDTTDTKLTCYSGAGFTDGLRAAAEADRNILLIDLERLYEPDRTVTIHYGMN